MRTSRPGFAVFDVVMGMFIVGALFGSLVFAMGGRSEATKRLAAVRVATDAAEQALAELRAGRVPNAKVEPVSEAPAPVGQKWVRVRVDREGRSTTLVGLVPEGAVKQ